MWLWQVELWAHHCGLQPPVQRLTLALLVGGASVGAARVVCQDLCLTAPFNRLLAGAG